MDLEKNGLGDSNGSGQDPDKPHGESSPSSYEGGTPQDAPVPDDVAPEAGVQKASGFVARISNLWHRFREWFEWVYLFRLIYLSIIGVLVVLLFDTVIMPLYTKQGKEVTLPRAEGMTREQADSLLTANGFRVISDRETHSRSVPMGVVISQNPLPESIVKRGRRIYLTISKGEKWVDVPKLVSQSERNAQELLRQVELVPNMGYEFSSLYPKGVVMEQAIEPGDSTSVGDTVTFIVSLGDIPENLLVPGVIGKSLREARRILIRTGLQIGIISYQVNNELLPETVIQQSIPADSLVDVGEPIDLIISTEDNSGG